MKKSHIHLLHLALACVGIAWLLLSCRGGLQYADYQEVEGRQWHLQDTLQYTIPASARDASPMLRACVRTTKEYGYKELVLKMELLDGDETVLSRILPIQLHSRNLLDAFREGLPVAASYSDPVQVSLKAGKEYTIRITHLMRLNTVEGIVDVGLLLEEPQSGSPPTMIR